MKKKEVRFDLSELLGAGMTLVVLGISISYGLNVMAGIRDGFVSGTAERNASNAAIKGVSVIPAKMETLATIVVASVIIGVLVNFLWARFK